MISLLQAGALILMTGFVVSGQTDWPVSGHDPGGTRYSPLKQIDTRNVDKLRLAWEFDTLVEDAPSPVQAQGAEEYGPGARPAPAARRPRRRMSESIPLVVGGVLYMSTGYNRIVALDAETGKKIWEYVS